MKKSFIAGAASLALATMPVVSTFALDPGSYTQDVTVGEVDETIYSVDINWGNMTFDWKYDYFTNTFGFARTTTCSETGIGAAAEGEPVLDNLFYDDACTEPVTTLSDSGPFYTKLPNPSNILVTDSTVNGRVKTRASFSPEDDYSWVTGRFLSPLDGEDLDDGYLVAVMGGQHGTVSDGEFYLEGDNTHITSDAVHAGDKIGTITITIEPDLN